MGQEVPTSDLIFGGTLLIFFLTAVFAAGKLLNRFKNGRFTQAWGPLIPIIHGTVTHDGGGAATSWLTGTHQGATIQASMTPNRNRYQEQSGSYYNYFDITMLNVPGQHNWQVSYETPVLGLGKTGWHLVADTPELQMKLEQQGIITAITQLGAPTVTYTARRATLHYAEDVGAGWVPTPEQFTAELTLLHRLAAINSQVNTT